MRLGILTCLWKRHELAAVMMDHTRFIAPAAVCVAVGSEGDSSRTLAEAHGWLYVESPNDPRGAKWNEGLHALRALGVDAVVILGSDDFIGRGLPVLWSEWHEAGIDYGGLLDCYVYRPADYRSCRWNGYPEGSPRHGETIGSGRFYSRRLLDAVDWRLWPETDAPTGLDRASHDVLAALPEMYRAAVRMDFDRTLVDVKADQFGVDIGRFEVMAAGGTPETPETVWAGLTPSSAHDAVDRLGLDVPPRLFGFCREPIITACIIAKDSAAYMANCLRSIAGIADECVVVMDPRTSQWDRSWMIAEAAGAFVTEREWTGFADQRNFAQGFAKTPWVLVIDTDEWVDRSMGGEAEHIVSTVRSAAPEVDGFAVRMSIGSVQGGKLSSYSIRIFRREVGSYRYARHNELIGVRNAIPLEATFVTTYEGDGAAKAQRAIDELEAWSPEDKDGRQHRAFFLAKSYGGIGNHAEQKRWADECVSIDPNSLRGAAAWKELAEATAMTGTFEDVDDVLMLATRAHPKYADLWHIWLSTVLLRWTEATLTPSPYLMLAQVSTPRLAVLAPIIARMLHLRVTITIPEDAVQSRDAPNTP